MKHFLFFTFLLFAVLVNAENIQELYYVPSSSGNYTNLIVKGDANINNMISAPFNIHSYGSLLEIRIANAAKSINIASFETKNSSGTATFVVDESLDYTPLFKIRTGYLSFYRINPQYDSTLNIEDTVLPQPEAGQEFIMQFNTQKLNTTNYNNVFVNSLKIFGMQVPLTDFDGCPNGYYWQPIKVKDSNGESTYNILSCNTTNCSHPEQEETCINKKPWLNTFPYIWIGCECIPWIP